IVSAYVEYQSGARKTTASAMEQILSKERMQYEKELTAKTKELLEFKAENGILSWEDEKGNNITTKKLVDLSDALTKVQLELVTAKTLYDGALALKDNPEALKQLIEQRSTTYAGAPAAVDRQTDELKTKLAQLEVTLSVAQRQL